MMLLCGIYYPVSILPKPFILLARLLPLTYLLDYFRSFYGVKASFGHSLATGYGLAFAYGIVAVAGLRAAIQRARRSGILLRLSE
jgi:ABC-2 type transport system permease protein